MSVSRVLLQSARLPLFITGSVSALDIKGWIANQNYYIDDDLTTSQFSLRAYDSKELSRALANDFNKMAIAAFESACGIKHDDPLPKSLAWAVIRSYYASFFSAHALMRMFGTSCSQLETDHTDKIFESAEAFGKAGGLDTVSSGFYSIEVDDQFTQVKFRKLRDSHKDTWNVFLEIINNLSLSISNTTALSKHKIEASNLLDEIKLGITRSNCPRGNWLSVLRNSVNYRHSHGAWYPYSARTTRDSMIDTASRDWLRAPSITGRADENDLKAFFSSSILLVSVLRELLGDATEISDPLNPVIRNGCMKLLNEVKVSLA